MVVEYAMSAPVPQNPTTSYLTTDNLGTPRINTDSIGNVQARHDYLPFGEEINRLGGRSANNGYQSDSIRQKYTQYERDNESDLDFAQARYYGSSLGRFTSPDPALASMWIDNPQSLNRYVYALNNPLAFIDPDGLEPIWIHDIKNDLYFSVSEEDKAKYDGVEGFEIVTNTGSDGLVITLNKLEGSYANDSEYRSLLGSQVYLGTGGRFHPVDPPSSSGYMDINISFGSPYFLGVRVHDIVD
jgi:RHS repeat-associated protein